MNILFLASWFPCPPNNGSKIRIFHLLRALSERHQVSVLSFSDSNEHYDLNSLCSVCRVIDVVPRTMFRPSGAKAIAAYLHPSPRSQVDTHSELFAYKLATELEARRYDALIASELSTIEYGLPPKGMIKILDEIQIGVQRDKVMQASSTLGRIRQRLTWTKLVWYMRRRLPRYDAVTVASSIEREMVSCVVPILRTIHVVPNGVDTSRLCPTAAEMTAGSLIYNGSLTFGANYDAMRYFVADIWPRILFRWEEKRSTGIPVPSLRITGSTTGVDLAPFQFPGVTLTGYVDDIAHEVHRAHVCVVPLRVGGGTRLKILEAMALGTPVVATSKGAEGLDVTHGENILIADDPQAFAEQVLRLLIDDDLRVRIARSARALVEAHYDWGMIGQQFCDLVEAVAARKAVESSA